MVSELRVSKAGRWQLVVSWRKRLMFETIFEDSCGRVSLVYPSQTERCVVSQSALKRELCVLVAVLLVSWVASGPVSVSEGSNALAKPDKFNGLWGS